MLLKHLIFPYNLGNWYPQILLLPCGMQFEREVDLYQHKVLHYLLVIKLTYNMCFISGASGAYLELLRTESDKKLITFSYRQVRHS